MVWNSTVPRYSFPSLTCSTASRFGKLEILLLDTTLNSQAEADVHALTLLRPHLCRHPELSLESQL